MIHSILGYLGFILIPLFWIIFNILGVRITFVEFYNEWLEHKNSGESWGIFD
jgi:hypothetical protein